MGVGATCVTAVARVMVSGGRALRTVPCPYLQASSLHHSSVPHLPLVRPPSPPRSVTSVVAELATNTTSATLVIAAFVINAAAAVDVLAQAEKGGGSGTSTPPPCIGAVVARKCTVGVDVGANVAGSRVTATPTPPAFPPSPAAAADNVDVAAEPDAKRTSRTPTLPGIGPPRMVVGVAAEFDESTSSATSTPFRLCMPIAAFAMSARLDDDAITW